MDLVITFNKILNSKIILMIIFNSFIYYILIIVLEYNNTTA